MLHGRAAWHGTGEGANDQGGEERRGLTTGADWPDRAEMQRWELAADYVARRLRDERGVDEPVGVSSGYGALWVTFGERRVRVAGAGPDVDDEQELFEDLDSWVAFDRDAGPGRVLDRDRTAVAAVLDRMPVAQRLWSTAVQRVLVDLHATTNLTWNCTLVVLEDEPAWMRPRPAGESRVPGLRVRVGPIEEPTGPRTRSDMPRPVWLPRLWLECDTGWGTTVDEEEDDAEVICADAAGRIAGEVVDELWQAWPPCPRHSHLLEAAVSEGRACWTCPADDAVVAPVGALASASEVDSSSAG